MSLDRAELVGTGAALAFHVALVAALSMSLARVDAVPEPPSMEVELVEELALSPTVPSPAVAPPPQSEAPKIAEAEPIQPAPAPTIEPAPPAPTIEPAPPEPRIEPAPPPRPSPQTVEIPPPPPRAAPVKATPRPSPKPVPARTTAPAKPVPAKPAPAIPAAAKPVPAEPAAAKSAPAKSPSRASRIGEDFLKGIDEAPARADSATHPAAATVSASAMAGIVQAIRRQVQPCADRQISPGPGANRIRVRMRLMLSPGGRLTRSPQVLGTSGIDEENSRYEERVKDLAVSTFVGCAPLTGLPSELYDTASGKGWSDFIMNYNLP